MNPRIRLLLATILLFAAGMTLWGQQNPGTGSQQAAYKLSGVVSDTDGLPVPGAAVLVPGGDAAVTDLQGRYTVRVRPDAVLSVECLGYAKQSVPVNGRAVINIVLETEFTQLEELVVVGYGTQKKVNLTGAVSVIKAEAIQDRSARDVALMLQGSVPGLNVTTASGQPGKGVSLNIRGRNSINGGSPLVLIDGAEGNLQFINPVDVESISVIKDAAAAAIYGAKGSAGVILVTTKSGSKEKDGRPSSVTAGVPVSPLPPLPPTGRPGDITPSI